jgi:hypothetical protein
MSSKERAMGEGNSPEKKESPVMSKTNEYSGTALRRLFEGEGGGEGVKEGVREWEREAGEGERDEGLREGSELKYSCKVSRMLSSNSSDSSPEVELPSRHMWFRSDTLHSESLPLPSLEVTVVPARPRVRISGADGCNAVVG